MSHPAPQRHKARRISYGGVSAEVDEKIAGLVLSMWKAGIQTEASCQDVGEGRAVICLSGRDEQAFRARVGPAAAELLTTEYHGSTGSAALSGRHYMRFQLADVPALRLGLRPPAVRTDAAV